MVGAAARPRLPAPRQGLVTQYHLPLCPRSLRKGTSAWPPPARPPPPPLPPSIRKAGGIGEGAVEVRVASQLAPRSRAPRVLIQGVA